MKPEEKDLLLKDLCARLPYEPVIEYVVKGITGNAHMICKLDVLHIDDLLQNSEDLVDVKPYLRPMSSMTEEEQKMALENSLECIEEEDPRKVFSLTIKQDVKELAYLYEHHYDVFGLIPAGLAISTEEFNPYNLIKNKE